MVWLTFGGIHVITLVFGMTLLGIAADYVFHYRAELLAEPDPKAARDKLARGLTVSLATSVAGVRRDAHGSDAKPQGNGAFLHHGPCVRLAHGSSGAAAHIQGRENACGGGGPL